MVIYKIYYIFLMNEMISSRFDFEEFLIHFPPQTNDWLDSKSTYKC